MTCGYARNASRCAAGEKTKQAGKRGCGAVDARGKGGNESSGEERCRECRWAGLDKQRFDGVVIDRRNKVHRLLILEFKRRTDTREEYWQEGMREAKEQYEEALWRACGMDGSAALCQS